MSRVSSPFFSTTTPMTQIIVLSSRASTSSLSCINGKRARPLNLFSFLHQLPVHTVVLFECNHIPTAQRAQKVPVLNIEQIIKTNKIYGMMTTMIKKQNQDNKSKKTQNQGHKEYLHYESIKASLWLCNQCFK